MTPFGHAATGYLIIRLADKKDKLAFLCGCVLPDIDFVLLPFSFFNSLHRVATHNLLFLSLAGLIAAVIGQENRIRRALLVFAGGLFHLLIDSVLDNNPSNGIGISLFYPFDGGMFSPFNLLIPDASMQGWSNLPEMLMHMGAQIAIEIPFIVAASLLCVKPYISHKKNARSHPVD